MDNMGDPFRAPVPAQHTESRREMQLALVRGWIAAASF
jgi:hypothetical protein